MGEQSHKSEMQAALQGDFERLRARREDGVEAPIAAPPVKQLPRREAVYPIELVAPDPAVAAAPSARPSWLERLRNSR